MATNSIRTRTTLLPIFVWTATLLGATSAFYAMPLSTRAQPEPDSNITSCMFSRMWTAMPEVLQWALELFYLRILILWKDPKELKAFGLAFVVFVLGLCTLTSTIRTQNRIRAERSKRGCCVFNKNEEGERSTPPAAPEPGTGNSRRFSRVHPRVPARRAPLDNLFRPDSISRLENAGSLYDYHRPTLGSWRKAGDLRYHDGIDSEESRLGKERRAIEKEREDLKLERRVIELEREDVEQDRRALQEERDLIEQDQRDMADERRIIGMERENNDRHRRDLEEERKYSQDERQNLEDERKDLELDRRVIELEREDNEREREHLQEQRNALERNQRKVEDERRAVEQERQMVQDRREALEREGIYHWHHDMQERNDEREREEEQLRVTFEQGQHETEEQINFGPIQREQRRVRAHRASQRERRRRVDNEDEEMNGTRTFLPRRRRNFMADEHRSDRRTDRFGDPWGSIHYPDRWDGFHGDLSDSNMRERVDRFDFASVTSDDDWENTVYCSLDDCRDAGDRGGFCRRFRNN